MKTLVRLAVLLLTAAGIAGVVYPLIAMRPPIHCEDVFPRERFAIAIGARKVLGVSLNRRHTKYP
jgi:hypothetical protein